MLLLPGLEDSKVEPELNEVVSIWHAWYMEFLGDKAKSSSTRHGNFEALVEKIKWHVSSDCKVGSCKHGISEFACMTLLGFFSRSQIPHSGGNGQSSSHSNILPCLRRHRVGHGAYQGFSMQAPGPCDHILDPTNLHTGLSRYLWLLDLHYHSETDHGHLVKEEAATSR